jgi:predicted nuclease with TOPRIM domain
MLVATKKELAKQVTELEVIEAKLKELQELEQARLDEMNEDSPKYEELTGELELLDTAIEAAEDLGMEIQAIVDGEN